MAVKTYTSKQLDQFHKWIGDYNGLLGGNGRTYMIPFFSKTHIGHQHVKYPLSWFDHFFTNGYTNKTFIGAWHNQDFTGTRHTNFTILDYEDYHANKTEAPQNWNAHAASISETLTNLFPDNLEGFIIYMEGTDFKLIAITKQTN